MLPVLELSASGSLGISESGLARKEPGPQIKKRPVNHCSLPSTQRSLRDLKLNVIQVNSADSASIWAVALSEDGQYLAGTSQDGHIKVWDLDANGEQIRDHETKGSFGTCIDLVSHLDYKKPSLNPKKRHTNKRRVVRRWPFNS